MPTAAPPAKDHSLPLFRKHFTLTKNIKMQDCITAHMVLYEAYLNGQRRAALFSWLDKLWKRLQYQVYDVTHFTEKGANATGAIVGDGWYRAYKGFSNKRTYMAKGAELLFPAACKLYWWQQPTRSFLTVHGSKFKLDRFSRLIFTTVKYMMPAGK